MDFWGVNLGVFGVDFEAIYSLLDIWEITQIFKTYCDVLADMSEVWKSGSIILSVFLDLDSP